jgi:hypothetical protein
MKVCSSTLRLATIGKKRNTAEDSALHVTCKQEKPMLKTLITVSTVLLATSAFAQSGTKSQGSSQYAPGQQMRNDPTSKGPGASEYSPGHQKNTAKGPGHSESAPGQQSTTGSAATDRTKKK